MNILKILIIAIIFAVSILVISFNPKMHKQVRLEEANFDLVQFVESGAPKPAPPANTLKAQAQKALVANDEAIPPSTVIPEKKIPDASPNLPSVKPPAKTDVQKPPVSQAVQKQQAPDNQLTAEEEEIIAWNKWRSDLQNQTMRDSHLIAPVGTKFNFSFTVDKFGNISNLRIWADPSIYTSLGMKVVRPVLLGYQGQPILNFPPKSKRVVVNIQGGFSMARTAKYSSPSDYSDFERVK